MTSGYPREQGTLAQGSASNLLRRGNVRAELHGLVWNFPAASAQSDRRDNRRKNDSAFHLSSPISPEAFGNSGLPSHLRGCRNIRTELHRLVRHFATAGSHSHSRDDRCENDRALHNLHVCLLMHVRQSPFLAYRCHPLRSRREAVFQLLSPVTDAKMPRRFSTLHAPSPTSAHCVGRLQHHAGMRRESPSADPGFSKPCKQ